MIGDNLYSLRKLHKLTQEEVSERVGVSRQALAKWASGETMPDICIWCGDSWRQRTNCDTI